MKLFREIQIYSVHEAFTNCCDISVGKLTLPFQVAKNGRTAAAINV